jgi:hypothetical protein
MVKARAAALGLGAKSALQGLKTHSEHFESVWWHFRVPFFIERVTCTGDVVIGFISIFRNGTSILGYRTSTAAAITIAGSKSDMSACFFFTEIAIRQIDLTVLPTSRSSRQWFASGVWVFIVCGTVA